jgi:hypothetical protein
MIQSRRYRRSRTNLALLTLRRCILVIRHRCRFGRQTVDVWCSRWRQRSEGAGPASDLTVILGPDDD